MQTCSFHASAVAFEGIILYLLWQNRKATPATSERLQLDLAELQMLADEGLARQKGCVQKEAGKVGSGRVERRAYHAGKYEE